MATAAELLKANYQVEVASPWLKHLKDNILAPITLETVNHPFIVGVEKGEVSRSQLIAYHSDLLWMNVASPEFVTALAARVPKHDHVIKARLVENAFEEISHPYIQKRLVNALGGMGDAIYKGPDWSTPYKYSEEVADLRILLECYCYKQPFVVGLAAFTVGVEAGVPRIFSTMADSLIRHYGLTEDDVEWLRIHSGDVEIEHGNTGLRALEHMVDKDDVETQAAICVAVRQFAKGMGPRLMDAAMRA